jgi:hypothetical protein
MSDGLPPLSGTDNSGTFFGGDRFASLPLPNGAGDWTLVAWFLWLAGPSRGPLIASDTERDWAFLYVKDDKLAYRVAGQERLLAIDAASIRDRWILLAAARSDDDLTLHVDDQVADVWTDPPDEGLSSAVVMKDAVGFAADIAYYEHRVAADRFTVYWNLGKHRPI